MVLQASRINSEQETKKYSTSPNHFCIFTIIPLNVEFLDNHSKDHDHDITKAYTLFVNTLSNLLTNILLLSGSKMAGKGTIGILVITAVSILGINGSDVIRILQKSFTSIKFKGKDEHARLLAKKKSKQSWLTAASKALITLGSVSYYIGNNLPNFLQRQSSRLNCDADCINRGMITGTFFTFVALTTFTFIPEIFNKLSKLADMDFKPDFIKEKMFEPEQMQWLVIRLMSLILQFDTLYASLWTQAIRSVNGCGTSVIIGSTACILFGWITWTIYAILYLKYLNQVKNIIANFKIHHESLQFKYYAVELLFYGTVVLFLFTFFPVHMTSINSVPLACGCSNGTSGHNTMTHNTTGGCAEDQGVLVVRVALLSYQSILLLLLTVIAVVKFNVKATKDI